MAADPFDSVDTTPGGSGIKYTWAYDEVGAAPALAAAGGGSRRIVAVVDTGVDIRHPELAGRIARTYDVYSHRADVTDRAGHGTFVAGLIAAVDGNGIGGKGVAGNTRLLVIRASRTGSLTVRALARSIEAAVARGADVMNLSLAGPGFSLSQARALATAFYNDVLPVAASGNNGRAGTRSSSPPRRWAARGAARRRPVRLGHHAGGGRTEFATHNDYVSIAAPGAGASGCELGVFSILPSGGADEWDDPLSCSRLFSQGAVRFGYGEGTSFAAPLVSGLAALVWQVQPRLASEQVAHVLTRTAHQTVGTKSWNEYTGAGLVDGGAAVALARVYDLTAPPRRGSAHRRDGSRVAVRIARARDHTRAGRELAGHVRYSILVSRDGGKNFDVALRRTRPIRHLVRLKGSQINAIATAVCDRNANCAIKRLGRFQPY